MANEEDDILTLYALDHLRDILTIPVVSFDSCYEHMTEKKPFKYEREHITKFQRPKRGKRK